MRRERNDRHIIRRVNKKRTSDTIKVVLLALVMMVSALIILWHVGNLIPDTIIERQPPRPGEEGYGYADDYPIYNGEDTHDRAEPDFPTMPPSSVILTGANYMDDGGLFELPIIGATGWAAAMLPVRSSASPGGDIVVIVQPGHGFTILETDGIWWYVQVDYGVSGWVDRNRCFINLPDILPSIIYQNTNASGSIMVSGGYAIPGITGEIMYVARAYNPRLGRDEYFVPGKFSLAQALFVAQQTARANNNTIIINEVFRPRSTQQAIVQGMNTLMSQNPDVRAAISTPPWGLGWFISTGISNHQRGAAVDASMARIRSFEYRQTGDFIYMHVLEFTELFMPTCMHELSPRASIVYSPRSISAADLTNPNLNLRDSVTPGVRDLQYAFGTAGFTPLASEWWHFDHPASVSTANSIGINGAFYVDTVVQSRPPVLQEDD